MSKLDSGQKHFLRLIVRDANVEGWCPVSRVLMPLVQAMPVELVETEVFDNSNGNGRAKLTEAGMNVIAAQEWI